jgi:hypothetical protein
MHGMHDLIAWERIDAVLALAARERAMAPLAATHNHPGWVARLRALLAAF